MSASLDTCIIRARQMFPLLLILFFGKPRDSKLALYLQGVLFRYRAGQLEALGDDGSTVGLSLEDSNA